MKTGKTPKIIVVTGAESTGKSVLTQQLSRLFCAPAFPEFSREYIEQLKHPYNYNDVMSIALMQNAQMNKSRVLRQEYVFFDTWLIITMVWFEVVFKKIPGWIPETIKNSPVDLFLLCDTDIPWVPDKVRENGGEMRELLNKRYLQIIREAGFKYRLVTGASDKRLLNAVDFIREI
jgi:nicotinamide riboside kinase